MQLEVRVDEQSRVLGDDLYDVLDSFEFDILGLIGRNWCSPLGSRW